MGYSMARYAGIFRSELFGAAFSHDSSSVDINLFIFISVFLGGLSLQIGAGQV